MQTAIQLGRPLHQSVKLLYLTLPATVLNVPERLLPTFVTAPMITTAISAAMRPYSMTVAPDSSRTKREKRFVIVASNDVTPKKSDRVQLCPCTAKRKLMWTNDSLRPTAGLRQRRAEAKPKASRLENSRKPLIGF
jgi:hypothetical protein